jgi:hypothetical protein
VSGKIRGVAGLTTTTTDRYPHPLAGASFALMYSAMGLPFGWLAYMIGGAVAACVAAVGVVQLPLLGSVKAWPGAPA